MGGNQIIDMIAVAAIQDIKLVVGENKVIIDYGYSLPDGTTETKEAIMIFPSKGEDGKSDPEVSNL